MISIGIKADGPGSGGMGTFYRGALWAMDRSAAVGRVVWFGAEPPDGPPGIELVRVPPRPLPLRVVANRRRYESLLRDHPVDVLLCAGNEAVSSAAATTVFLPMTVAPYDPAVARALWGRRARVRAAAMRALIRRSLRRADLTVFSSRHAREQIDPQSLATAGRVIPLAFESPTHEADHGGPTPVEDREPIVLAVSHLYPYKRIVEAVRGFAEYVDRHPGSHVRLLIAGATPDGAYRAEVMRTAVQLDIAERVELIGLVDRTELASLYDRARALLFTSQSENAGSFVLYEAMTAGLPIVTTDASSTPEVCGDAVRYCDVEDPSSVAAGLASVLDGTRVAAELARRGRARAVADGGWGRWLDEFVDAVSGVSRTAGG